MFIEPGLFYWHHSFQSAHREPCPDEKKNLAVLDHHPRLITLGVPASGRDREPEISAPRLRGLQDPLAPYPGRGAAQTFPGQPETDRVRTGPCHGGGLPARPGHGM